MRTPATRWSMAAHYDREGADELVFLDITATVEGREATLDVISQVGGAGLHPADGGRRRPQRRRRERAAARRRRQGGAEQRGRARPRPPPAMRGPLRHAVHGRRDRRQARVRPRRLGGLRRRRAHAARAATRWAGPWRPPPSAAPARCSSPRWTATARARATTSELLQAIAAAVRVPVIASGGAGDLDHFAEALTEGHADAVLAASRLHFGQLTIREIKEYLASKRSP